MTKRRKSKKQSATKNSDSRARRREQRKLSRRIAKGDHAAILEVGGQ